MIIRKLQDIVGTERDVFWGNGQSRRFLLRKDNMGYSLTDTIINANTESKITYKNHLETCYCIEGRGEVETMDGKKYTIEPGTIYALDQYEAHFLRAADKDMRLICVFTPPLEGNESHDLKNTTVGVSTYKREDRRSSFSGIVNIKLIKTEVEIECYLADVGRQGLGIYCPHDIEVKEQIEIVIPNTPKRGAAIQGQILWSKHVGKMHRIGIKFQHPNSEAVNELIMAAQSLEV